MNKNHLAKLKTAKRLIAKHGRQIDLVVKGALKDPSKPWLGTDDDTTISVVGAFVPFRGSGFGETSEQVDMLKRVTSVCLIAPDTTVDVTSATSIKDGSDYLGIEWVEILKPADVTILIGMGVNR